jgi:alkanesulfonate monooxygenase SsuD/methylene tetrahydromethanopterin reductase-like flavin-dependent oxidoreductase (luciferase family)
MALAVKTTAIRLGTLVSCVYYRSPALLARLATDVDQASGGRVIFGIGNGDNRSEFERLGMEFPPVRERQAALEEAIQIIRGLWGGGPVTLEGQHFRVREATLGSGPIQQPHVPVLIAGSGERHTLRQVAQYADMSNFGAHAAVGSVFTTAEVQHKIKVLSDHCIALGRPPDSVVRSHWGCPVVVGSMPEEVQRKVAALPAWIRDRFQSSMIAGIPEEVAATYQTLMTAGLNYFTICVMSGDAETLRLLAEQVMPSLAARQTWRAPGPGAR